MLLVNIFENIELFQEVIMILGIYGTGGNGREVFDIIQLCKNSGYEKIVFIDDTKNDTSFLDCELYDFSNLIMKYLNFQIEIVVAVGEPEIKKILYNKVRQANYSFATVIHPEAEISPSAKLGRSVVIKKGGIVSCDAILGDAVGLEPYAVVGHDSRVGAFTQLSAFVNIGGFAEIGSMVYIGLSTCVKDRAKVGNNTIVSMASAVIRDLPEEVIAVGNPARPMKKNENHRVF